ncbi:hypothetical protein AB0K18_47940 [Nonomuraea sp. NPDC049421]|uniref:hypothetical protein n=1 Tax=Nonomuraea sp. NPDC049421 TaxID=3155275 RepID=UPI0034392DF9
MLIVVFSSGCAVLQVAVGGGLCQERADHENALVRKMVGPVLSEAGLVGSMEDQSDCDSATYGSYVVVFIEKVKPRKVVAAFVRAGWSSRPASERSRDCAAGCDAYDLTKKAGERTIDVSVEGTEDVKIVASAAYDCWDADGYSCVDG